MEPTILTVNDHTHMREVFARLDFERVDIQCMVGGAGDQRAAGEQILYSWNRADDPADLY
jgi:DNA adenine methylase